MARSGAAVGLAVLILLALAAPARAHEAARSYRWLQPPEPQEASTAAPIGRRAELLINGGPLAMWTSDDQARVDFRSGAFAVGDRIEVRLEPVPLTPGDQALLLRDGRHLGANAIQVRVRDLDADEPVDLSAAGAMLTIVTPHPAREVVVLVPGTGWEAVPLAERDDDRVVVALDREGTWVVLADHARDDGPPRRGIALGAALVGIVSLWRRGSRGARTAR